MSFTKKSHKFHVKLSKENKFLFLSVLLFFISVLLINRNYGLHQDELAFLVYGQHLAWGYVETPPFTPFIAHIAQTLFGLSISGLRFFAALAISSAMFVTGLMARELGGSYKVQIAAAFAAVTTPIVLFFTSFFSYEVFDYLWWVVTTYLLIKLVKTENPRWWIGIGVAIGIGLLTKYTILVLAAGIAVGLLMTPERKYLKNPWLWSGATLALLIFLPNLIWQVQHHFISFAFIRGIHARDIQDGRTTDFLLNQLFISTNIFALLFWLSGLYYYAFSVSGTRYRLIGMVYLIVIAIFIFSKGRDYYAAPLYPMLIAAGAVQFAKHMPVSLNKFLYAVIFIWGISMTLIIFPQGTVNGRWWKLSERMVPLLNNEIGWPDIAKTVAHIRSTLPLEERTSVEIYTENYGIAGAIDVYGKSYGLPEVISGVNSYWLRGYPTYSPKATIVVGATQKDIKEQKVFATCRLAGHITNKYKLLNTEAMSQPDIFICTNQQIPWSHIWQATLSFQ